MSRQPMLAAKLEDDEVHKLRFPMFVSPKFDGIRLLIDPDVGAVSRTWKPVPNRHIQDVVAEHIQWMQYLDGEIIVGEPTAPDVFNKTQSAVMSQGGKPEIHYYVFDHYFYHDAPYNSRLDFVKHQVHFNRPAFAWEEDGAIKRDLYLVPQDVCLSWKEVLNLEAKYLEMGYEGIILRSTTGLYKYGRSTIKQGHLIKYKRVQDAEAVIIGFVALERNQNAQTRDLFGHARRSSHKAGKVVDDLLGALVVRDGEGRTFNVGSGFDVSTREEIWRNKEKYEGQTITFKYQPTGMKDLPRFPIFKGFRHD